MKRYALRVPLELVAREVMSIPLQAVTDGAGSSHYGGNEGWISGLENRHLDMSRLVFEHPYLYAAVGGLARMAGIGSARGVMVNKLRAGNSLKAHKDGASDCLRFHLPIVTHPSVVWWDEFSGSQHMERGWWYGPVMFSGVTHSMHNPSDVDRVHVVADFYISNEYEGVRTKVQHE